MSAGKQIQQALTTDDKKTRRGGADRPTHVSGPPGVNEKTAAGALFKKLVKVTNMGRCNRPAVAFGLDQPAFVINNDLSVSAAIPAVRRITNDRQPLSFQRQQQQFLKYIRVNFAQVPHTLAIPGRVPSFSSTRAAAA